MLFFFGGSLRKESTHTEAHTHVRTWGPGACPRPQTRGTGDGHLAEPGSREPRPAARICQPHHTLPFAELRMSHTQNPGR